ncbi:aspartate/glutamate racemase family protein [Lachnospiraceae bacterium OttesenSCG-928-E19]|nr:aspartate/glutamate racemase family protein [Lachnospiraceae bacterium OttesenSCG-928-E19]
MKKIGIIGGMSLQSTIHYIEDLNNIINGKLGGLTSPRILLSSVDFSEYEPLQRSGDWDLIGKRLAAEAKDVQAGGADFIILATNTMHKVADQIISVIDIPFIHIADATCDVILADGIKNIGLLGTKYTMEQDFYKGKLESAGLNVIVPNAEDRMIVNDIIFNELCLGIVKHGSVTKYQEIISKLKDAGAQGVILGCTEIGMLVTESVLPLYDTTKIHVNAAAELAIKK